MTINKIKFGVLLGLSLGLSNSCGDDFLTITPNGSLDATVLATAKGVDGLLIGAYSMLDGVASNGFGWEAASSNWVYGSIRGLEANKGTDSGDQPDINPIQSYNETSTNPYLNVKWRSVYDGIARCNAALTVLAQAVADNAVTAAEADSFERQAKALRGFFHFEAYRMWAKSDGTGIPYVEETTDQSTLDNLVDVRPMIIADLTAGAGLPNNMGQVGRFNGTVAKVLLAKALMQMNSDYSGAKTLLLDVVATGTAPDGSAIGLEARFGDVFDLANRNGIEAIYTVQYSVNDGSGGWNGGWGEVLNFPYKSGASPGGCCGFFQPSHDFANSFRTSAGLPLLDDSYNTAALVDDQGLTSGSAGYVPDLGPVDPRLDWSVGRRGVPYLDWGLHTGQDWIRDQSYAGPFSPMKQVYKLSQQGTNTEVGNWTSGWTQNGYRMIRYADVRLLLAECQIETEAAPFTNALTNINMVRARASNPAGFAPPITPTPVTYAINQYAGGGVFPFDTQANARKALRFERKLELGMEGHRYFDLQRWGIVQSDLNRILTYEKTRRATLYGPDTVDPVDVNYPIPQLQIDLSQGRLVQNR